MKPYDFQFEGFMAANLKEILHGRFLIYESFGRISFFVSF